MSTIQTSISHNRAIRRQPERIELLYRDEQSDYEFWETLENLRESVLASKGQFISLDLAEPQTEPLLETFYVALNNASEKQSVPFSLPVILQHNPRSASPFINRAILWQRLCDLLILDDEPYRDTVLVLENADQASPAVQHDIARLIRFHEVHSIRRTFVFTLNRETHGQMTAELRNVLRI